MTHNYNKARAAEARLLEFLQNTLTLNTIEGELVDWAVDGSAYGVDFAGDTLTADDWEALLENVASRMGEVNCAACSSPAPVYNGRMAEKLAEVWSEVDDALDGWERNTGEYWTPNFKGGSNFLSYLWFAYEYFAADLHGQIEGEARTWAEELAATEEGASNA